MRRITPLAVSLFSGLVLALFALGAGAQAIVAQHDEASLAKGGAVIFQRGVFRIADSSPEVTLLCIPVKGQWKQVGTERNCGNPPPREQQREISRFTPDITYLGVRNLGIATAQWGQVQKMLASGDRSHPLRKVGEAFSYSVTASDVRWRFESQKLPDQLKTPIPGSGFHVHFGGLYSDKRQPLLFEPKSGAARVEIRMAMPKLALTGKAHTGLSVAVDLDVPTDKGNYVAVPVIVSLFHPHPGEREAVRSDGRVNFAASYLGPGNRYVHAVENRERSTPWAGLENFVFTLSRENVRNILADANSHRRTGGGGLLDQNVDRVRLAGVTLRNESRFLEQGDVTAEVIVDYVRVVRAAN
jgi:hypothetical protein